MCTDDTKNIVNSVLDTFLGQKRAFTAFEVSLEAKKLGATERHRDMKDYIHTCQIMKDETEFGDYEKTLISVGQGRQAYLYHLSSYDINQYVPLQTGGAKSTQSIPTTQTVSATTPTPSATKSFWVDQVHTVDHRNRLMVPTRFMRDAGFEAGDRVNVIRSDGSLFVTSETTCVMTGDTVSSQIVERNGDIRVALSNLTQAGLQNGSFDFAHASYNGDPAVVVFNVDSNGNRII